MKKNTTEGILQIIALIVVASLFLLWIGSPDLHDCLLYWITDGAIELPKGED